MKQKILETRTCKWFGEKFDLYDKDIELLEKVSPTIGGEKHFFDLPSLSPKAREINRLMFRNERKFYKIKLKNGKTEISTVHNEVRDNIVNYDEFCNSDFLEHGISYSGDFYRDLKKVFFSAPNPAMVTIGMENSAYCNQEAYDKNCYLNSGGHENEDSIYNTFAIRSKDVADNYWVFDCEIVFESVSIFNSQKIFFSQNIKDSFNCFFSYDLKSCHNVIFGVGMENSDYIYKNQKLSKEEWLQKYNDVQEKQKTRKGIQNLEEELRNFINEIGIKKTFVEQSENIVGNHIYHSKSAYLSYYGEKVENVRYSNITWDLKDSMDISSFADGTKLYNIASSYKINNCSAGSHILDSNDIFNSFLINLGNSFFGCYGFGLENKSFLILNKQYSEKEWNEKVKEIIFELKSKGIWGKFLPPELSPYPYNDSVAYEYYPIKEAIYLKNEKITKTEIINEKGIGRVYILDEDKFISDAIIDFGGEEKIKIKWRTKETEININSLDNVFPLIEETNIDQINNSILEKVIICKRSKRPYKIVKKELEFYKKYGIAIPNLHYDERHKNRLLKK